MEGFYGMSILLWINEVDGDIGIISDIHQTITCKQNRANTIARKIR